MANLLYAWAKIHKLGRIEKRQLFNELISEKLKINCEARIYRVLTRLTFQTLRKKHEISFEYTSDEIEFTKS